MNTVETGQHTAGVSYKRASLAEHWDAIVIGSGLGGLAAAALLAKHGEQRVLVLERHYVPGGYSHVFRRPGFEWDSGVHYVGNVTNERSKVRAAFDHLSEGRLKWAPLPDVYDEVRVGDRHYPFHAGREAFAEGLAASFPNDRGAIEKYLDAIALADLTSSQFFLEKNRARRATGAPRSPSAFLGWAGRTTRDVLSRFTSNEELIGVLTGRWGNYGLPPGQSSFGMHAIMAMHYLSGAAFPVGGTGMIASSIIPTIEAAGGAVVVRADVERVLTRASGAAYGVRMADGREFTAPCVISNAGARNTFTRLLHAPEMMPEGFLETLEEIAPSTCYVNLYVGLDAPASELGITSKNLWVLPSYDADRDVAAFARDLSAPFPSLFVSFPGAKDPEFQSRYPGHSTVEIMSPVPWQPFARWESTRWGHRGPEYDELKGWITQRLRDELEREVPGARGHVVHAELSTPVTTRHFMNYTRGEGYGLSVSPARFAFDGLKPQTPVPNLYLTGQDVVAPGLCGALFGGILVASAVLGRDLVVRTMSPSAVLTEMAHAS